jgi:hypothetical protein
VGWAGKKLERENTGNIKEVSVVFVQKQTLRTSGLKPKLENKQCGDNSLSFSEMVLQIFPWVLECAAHLEEPYLESTHATQSTSLHLGLC